MSIGCGPCTDLFALDCMKMQKIYQYNEVNYVGVDPLEKWKRIHTAIKNNLNDIKLFLIYRKIQDILPQLAGMNFKSDIIIMNYLLSDL